MRDGAWSSILKLSSFTCEVRLVSNKLAWFCDSSFFDESRANDANKLFDEYDKAIKSCPGGMKSEYMKSDASRRAFYFRTGDTILSMALVKDIDMGKAGTATGWRLRIYAAE